MALAREPSDVRLSPAEGEAPALPFKRHLAILGVVLAAAELAVVGYPLWTMFGLDRLAAGTALRIGVPVAVGAAVA